MQLLHHVTNFFIFNGSHTWLDVIAQAGNWSKKTHKQQKDFKDKSKSVAVRIRSLWLSYRNLTRQHCRERSKHGPSATFWPGARSPLCPPELLESGDGVGIASTWRMDMVVNAWLGRNLPNLFKDGKLHPYRKTVLFPSKVLAYSFSSPCAELRIKLCLNVLFFIVSYVLSTVVCCLTS